MKIIVNKTSDDEIDELIRKLKESQSMIGSGGLVSGINIDYLEGLLIQRNRDKIIDEIIDGEDNTT